MSNFDDFLQKARPQTFVGGSFDCQFCDLWTDGAFFDHDSKALIWTCPDGHTSMIEEFNYG